jgi:hypothetical protein
MISPVLNAPMKKQYMGQRSGVKRIVLSSRQFSVGIFFNDIGSLTNFCGDLKKIHICVMEHGIRAENEEILEWISENRYRPEAQESLPQALNL